MTAPAACRTDPLTLLGQAAGDFHRAVQGLEELIAQDSSIQAQLALDSVMMGFARVNDARALLRATTVTRKPLTVRQRQIYDYIAESIESRGYAPSYTDIAGEFQFGSLATVHEHLTNLERKGYLIRQVGQARAITLVGPSA